MNLAMKHKQLFFGAATALAIAACVEHRPIRNGLTDEAVYLTKSDLTLPNPKLTDRADDGWLFKVTIVKASSPNVVGDYAFPGLESDSKYVKFRFKEDVLQMIDGRRLQHDNADDPNDDLSTSADRVVMEFGGRHVDIKLRESLDGERTNLLEENTEEPWMKRQKFKVDWEKTSMDPITAIAWFYGDFLRDCAGVTSTHMVPDSFEWDPADQYLSFKVEVNYELRAITNFGGCWDITSLATGVGSATIEYRFSFYRPGPSTFQPTIIPEKQPVRESETVSVNSKYGAFQDFNIYMDEETGLMNAVALLRRWDPNRTEPVVFYFEQGFPERFKPMFQEIEMETNAILERAGASLRFQFKEHDHDGVERHFGDIRYSFVTWHQDIEGTRGLLGYGPSSSDPRTGELISANLNLYNIGMDYYRFLIQDYLETFGGTRKMPELPWEQTPCMDGETVAPADGTQRLSAQLFQEMRRTMDLPAHGEGAENPADDFVPTPHRGKELFLADYHRTLSEFRYSDPLWNPYTYMPTGRHPITQLPERMAKEKQFQEAMGQIMMNQDPFKGVALTTREGIEKQIELLHNFRDWRKNHDRLMADEQMMLGKRSISTFDANDALTAISSAARRCVNGFFESDEAYTERIIEDVVHHIAVHEFGHNLSLRHNFYGSVDAKHMREGEISASVMDYVGSWEEAGHRRGWGSYDEAALKWIYGTDTVRDEVMQEDFLYCTDDHRSVSALCTAHDLGVTPSQIVLNAIERYDWLYEIRNKRAFRTFWDTSWYASSVYNAVFPLLRIWYLGIFDWYGGQVQGTLKKLDQVNGAPVLSDPEYDEISYDFYNDMQAAIGMIMAFYDSVINQPASFRDYQTKFDPYYGDVIQIGIIIDKLFATFAFMDLQEVYNYNPNVYTYVSMYDATGGGQNFAIGQRVLDDMLGASYDTFPWFKYYALLIFASVTNSNLVGSIELKDRIAIQRYENAAEIDEMFWPGFVDDVVRLDNPEQTFVYEGQEYVYTYLADRNWHLIAGKSRSPVSFQYLKDYNQALNASASTDQDTFGLKILLAYYEYFNNFVGF